MTTAPSPEQANFLRYYSILQQNSMEKDTDENRESKEQKRHDALEGIIDLYINLIRKVANKFRCRSLEFEDLVQEGILILLKAISKYEPERGTSFSTLLETALTREIRRVVNNSDRTIRLPTNVAGKQGKILKTRDKLTQELGREPTIEELAEATRVNQVVLQQLLTEWELYSLDFQPFRGGHGGEITAHGERIVELIPDENAVNPVASALSKERQESIATLVKEYVTPKELIILTVRFGLDGSEPQPLREAKRTLEANYGIYLSHEGIRKIMLRAGRTLKAAIKNAGLEP